MSFPNSVVPSLYFLYLVNPVCQWHTPRGSGTQLSLVVGLAIPHGKRAPLATQATTDDLQNCAYCMIPARIDKSVILQLLSMIQGSSVCSTRYFFCCYCLQVVTKNWLSPYWSLGVLTLGESHCEDQVKKANLFPSSKKRFWQTLLFFQNCTS